MSHAHPVEDIHHSTHREINELYWSLALLNFAVGLIGLFIPIFIFEYFDRSLAPVFIFFGLHSLAQILLVPYAAKLLHRVGVKKTIALGRVCYALYFGALTMLSSGGGWWLLIVASVVRIAFLLTAPVGRHVDFALAAGGGRRGRQISGATIVSTLSRAIAPLIGGFLIVSFGYTPVFVFAMVMVLFSTMPLFFSAEVYETYTLSWKQSFTRLFNKRNRRAAFSFIGEGIDNTVGLFALPIFLFLVVGSLDTLGWITSLVLGLTFVFTYLIGWLTDKKGAHRVITFTSIAHGFSWIFNAFIVSPFQYAVIGSFHGLAAMGNRLPMITLFYQHAKRRNHGVDEYVVFHEIAHNIGRVCMFALLAIGFGLGASSFMPFFLIAAGSTLLYRLMR